MIDRLSTLVTRHAIWIVTIALLLLAVSLARLVDFEALASGDFPRVLTLTVDPSMTSVLPTQSPARDYHERLRETFGNDETLLLAVRHPTSVFEPEFLASLMRTTDALLELEGLRDVMSLANTDNIRAAGGEIVTAPLYDEQPKAGDRAESDRIRRELWANPILSKSLVSEDGRTTAIVGYLEDMTEAELMSLDLGAETLAIARREFGSDTSIWLTGGAHIKTETQRILYRDLATVLPAIVIVLMLIGWLSFRSFLGVLVPMATLGLAIVWALALGSFLFDSLNVVTISVPSILMGVGFAYAIHVLSAYYEVLSDRERMPAGDESSSPAREALRRVGLATFLTCLTTAVGFLSIALSPITAVREFGVFCAIGVVCLLVSNFAVAPALLELLPVARVRGRRRASSGEAAEEQDWIDRLLARLAIANVANRRVILAAGAAAAVLAIAGIPWIRISTDVIENFPEDLEIRRSIDTVNEVLGGADQVYVVVESASVDAFKEPDALRRLVELERWLDAQPEVGSTTSVADYVRLLNRAFHNDDPSQYVVPDSRALIGQLLLIGAGDDIDRLVDSEFRIARIPVRVSAFDSAALAAFAERVERRLADLPAELDGRLTGLSVLVAQTNDDIAYGQAVGLLAAFGIIYLIMSLLFTSFRVGFVAMIPNVLPVLIYFGALGWFGITLNVVTGLVACLVLGIAVDDTVHFLTRFNTLARESGDAREGGRLALMEVGRAVTYTSMALCAGFLVLTASTLQQQVEFGALAAFTLAVAWGVDVTFTPAFASGLRVVTLWDLLALDLGKDPVHTIELFEGLRPREAKILALMGTLVDAKAGRALFHSGEQAQGLFVVISGSVRTWIDAGEQNLSVTHHAPGATVGEIGLFEGEHDVNAEVEKDARLLRLTQHGMDELGRRYPRIAAVVLRNTTRMLAARLSLQARGQRLGLAFEAHDGAASERAPGAPRLDEYAIGNAELQASLSSLGLTEQTQRALGLIPMVEVAWADGRLAGSERSAILDAASSLGIEPGSRSHGLLEQWLRTAPDPELFRAWREYVESLSAELSIEGRYRLQNHVIGRARAVAAAAGGLAGLRTVSRSEHRVLVELEAFFVESSEQRQTSSHEVRHRGLEDDL